jgi:hypothetical protein
VAVKKHGEADSMKLPKTKDMAAALKAAGQWRSLDTIRAWRCGRFAMPLWVAPVIADGCGVDLAELVREFARRWEAKQ